MNYRNTSVILLFILSFSFLILQSPVHAEQTLPPVIGDRSLSWIQQNCEKTGKTRNVDISSGATYEQYRCENIVQVNLTNRGKSQQGVIIDQDTITIDYSIDLSLKPGSYDKFLNAKLTHFGPNDNFITKIGAHNIHPPMVEGETSASYTGYKLQNPRTVNLKVGEQNTLDASITIDRPDEYEEGLGIFSSFVKLQYNRDVTVWILPRPEVERSEDEVMTNEGVTVRLEPSYYVVPGELDTILSVSPVRNHASLLARQTRYNVGPDTKSVVYIPNARNLADNSMITDEEARVSGAGDQFKADFTKVNKQSDLFEAELNYYVLEGFEGKDPRHKSAVQGIILRNPAPKLQPE